MAMGDEWTAFARSWSGSGPFTPRQRVLGEPTATPAFHRSTQRSSGSTSSFGLRTAAPGEFHFRSDRSMFGVDYPHFESIFPGTRHRRPAARHPDPDRDDARRSSSTPRPTSTGSIRHAAARDRTGRLRARGAAHRQPAVISAATRAAGSRWTVTLVLAAIMTAADVSPATAAEGDDATAVECAGWLGDPVSGSPEWSEADLNNQQCAAEGLRMLQESPAVAAAKAANADAGEGDFGGDPFRAPHRWADKRGRYEQTTYTDRDGTTWPAALFGPRDVGGGPYPGVLLVCHACFPLPLTTENIALWYWAAETLAEAGYVVMYAAVGGNSVPRTTRRDRLLHGDSTSPTSRGEFNPWHARLDRNRLGIVGHSGAAGVALNVGNSDPRYDAIVAWDPAASATLPDVMPRIPTMFQVADYTLREGPVPTAEKPVPAPGSKYTFFDTFRAAGVDVMQVAPGGIHAPRLDAVRRGEPLRPVARPWRLRRDGRRVLHAGVAGSVRRATPRRYARPSVNRRPWPTTPCGASLPAARSLRPVRRRALDRRRTLRRRKEEEPTDEAGNVPIKIGGLHPEPAVVPVRLPLLPQRRRVGVRRHARRLPLITALWRATARRRLCSALDARRDE